MLATEIHDWDRLRDQYHVVELSALKKDGLALLKDHLYQMVSTGEHEQDDIIISNIRHYESLLRTNEAFSTALKGIQSGITADIVAMDIRHAIRYLGEIQGSEPPKRMGGQPKPPLKYNQIDGF